MIENANFCRPFFNNFSSSRRLLLLITVFILVLLSFNIATFYLTSFSNSVGSNSENTDQDSYDSKTFHGNSKQSYDIHDINDLHKRVQELLRIRSSVLQELRYLEHNRSAIIKELNEKTNEIEKLKHSVIKKSSDLEHLQIQIQQAVIARKEAREFVDTLIEPPLSLLPKNVPKSSIENEDKSSFDHKNCRMFNCFDYSRCSLFSPFNVYLYDNNHQTLLYKKFRLNQVIVTDPKIACIYLIVIDEGFFRVNHTISKDYLNSFPYWADDGRNHVIFNDSPKNLRLLGWDPKRAILVQTQSPSSLDRSNFDILLPKSSIINSIAYKSSLLSVSLSPARRRYFLSFLTVIEESITGYGHSNNNILMIKNTLLNLISKSINHEEFYFDFQCDSQNNYNLCDNATQIMLNSTFTLLPAFDRDKNLNLDNFYHKFLTALSTGAIPVIIYDSDVSILPYEEIIDWRRAAIRLPLARITETYILLKTYTDSDLVEMRHFCRELYRKYFSSLDRFISTFFSFIGTYRLQKPPSPIINHYSSYYYHQAKYDNDLIVPNNDNSDSFAEHGDFMPQSDDEEYLGPIESPFSSLTFRRNFSFTINQLHSMWNDLQTTPLYLFPSLPFDPILPTDSKFFGSSYGFRPIGGGYGGSGKEFSEALGGNSIREQFTIVILTYERENVLLSNLANLKNLPYLNKVIIVWNTPRPPPKAIKWPNIGANIVVVKSKENSLNNRFLPFNEIKTEAILSIDDDTNLRHDEIIFAFRVWREARDRIVGFPARYHSWNSNQSSWLYNSNYTCEYSMILTGAAFLHKYYLYYYSYLMPHEIRKKVDEVMNCEDIAMNFLVSHLTRKPPIKVTSRWTFRCPNCANSLWGDHQHFDRRHQCINYFVSIYGYMPLMYSQFRADSVLFKTRISHNKQKCFKFV